jgi:GT2 family glycosyltransferase
MVPVLILTCNNLELTKRCVDSFRAQDVETEIKIVDNGSVDGTVPWFNSQDDLDGWLWNSNRGVSAGWNYGIHSIFAENRDARYICVANNDTVAPPYCISKLLSYDLPFVTGVSVDEPKDHPDCWTQPSGAPDFSLFLLRRDAWEAIGPFDERMKFYAQDLDYHIRAWRKGIHLMNAGVPFHHERSSTLRNASIFARDAIQLQAEMDRQELTRKWGCNAWDESYQAMFSVGTFGCEKENVNV